MAAPTYKLTYFNGRGLGEVARVLFQLKGQAFEDARFALAIGAAGIVRPEFDAAKAAGELPMGQVPILEVTNATGSHKFCQSKAIERYLAKQFDLAGANAEEAAVIDMFGELLIDVRTKYGNAKDDAAKDAFVTGALPEAIKYLEAQYAKNGSHVLVGATPTIVDAQLFVLVKYGFKNFFTTDHAFADRVLALLHASAPIQAAIAKIAAVPAVAANESIREGTPF